MKMNSSRKRIGMPKSRKGIMLTLLVIIVFVLMLSEITAYIAININFNQLTQSASATSNQGGTAKLISSSAASLLQASLAKAVAVLSNFEANPSARLSFFPNDAAISIESLMENGTLGSHDLSSEMGTALIGNLTNTINARFESQGIGFKLLSGSLNVFDGSPSSINASFTAIAVISTDTGTFTYPLYAGASLQLNGTEDIAGIESAQPTDISIAQGYPKARAMGMANAIASSMSPYAFAYGTIVNISGTPTCSGIPSQLLNENTILVTPDGADITNTICGMGGLVTYVLNASIPLKPYLLYSPASGVINSVVNGTGALLDGEGRTLLDIAPIRSAIVNGSYYASPMLPSYLDRASSGVSRSVGGGLFSFNLLQRTSPYFSDGGTGASTSNIFVKNQVSITPEFSISFWFNKKQNSSSANCGDILSTGGTSPLLSIEAATAFSVPYCGSTSMDSMPIAVVYKDSAGSQHTAIAPIAIPSNEWVHGVLVFGAGTLTWYINWQRVAVASGIVNPPLNINSTIIGSGAQSFNGSVSDVQIYNAPLTSADVHILYLEGISGLPLQGRNLTEWYPLNGNGNDYSGYGFNGTDNNANFRTLRGYYGDPIYAGTFTDFNSSVVAGVLNCNNFSQCSNPSQHLYLQNLPLGANASSAQSEASTLGLPDLELPKSLAFTGSAGGFVQQKSAIPWLASAAQPFSLSIWIYPKSNSGVVIEENNQSQGFHNSVLELVGGSAYLNFNGISSCQNLGPVPTDAWTNIVLTYDGANNMHGFINGAAAGSAATGTFGAPANAVYYNLGKSDTNNCGSGAFYNGLMSDYQVYNVALTPLQVSQLYLNDTLASVPANMLMPLGTENAGMQNTTAETTTGDYGIFFSNGGACTASNVTNWQCGIYYTPP